MIRFSGVGCIQNSARHCTLIAREISARAMLTSMHKFYAFWILQHAVVLICGKMQMEDWTFKMWQHRKTSIVAWSAFDQIMRVIEKPQRVTLSLMPGLQVHIAHSCDYFLRILHAKLGLDTFWTDAHWRDQKMLSLPIRSCDLYVARQLINTVMIRLISDRHRLPHDRSQNFTHISKSYHFDYGEITSYRQDLIRLVLLLNTVYNEGCKVCFTNRFTTS